AELNNDPIYADQNFSNIVKQGEGNEFTEDVGNGDAGDYTEQNIPVESEFGAGKNDEKAVPDKKPVGPTNLADEFKKDVPEKRPAAKDSANGQPKAVMPGNKATKSGSGNDKSKASTPAKSDY
ncbi:MAG: hypothetical protein ABIR19_03725, partial [Ginsengibacter sp.]